jgi:hypothetical protein
MERGIFAMGEVCELFYATAIAKIINSGNDILKA